MLYESKYVGKKVHYVKSQFAVCMYLECIKNKKELHITCNSLIFMWAHLGLNQGPPDYESGALTS